MIKKVADRFIMNQSATFFYLVIAKRTLLRNNPKM